MALKLDAGECNRTVNGSFVERMEGGSRELLLQHLPCLMEFAALGSCHPLSCPVNRLALFCNSGLVWIANGKDYGGATCSLVITRASGCRCHRSHA